jgi:hypothetical protein
MFGSCHGVCEILSTFVFISEIDVSSSCLRSHLTLQKLKELRMPLQEPGQFLQVLAMQPVVSSQAN